MRRSFSSGRTPWQSFEESLRWKMDGGSVAIQAEEAQRFSIWDEAFGTDAWWEFASKTYGNLRFRFSPEAEILPKVDGWVELYQGFEEGWELSAGYRRMDFSESDVDIWTGSVARYVGHWYLRGRASLVRIEGQSSGSYAAAIRRYLATADDFVELQGRIGEEVVVLGPGPRVDRRDVGSLELRAQKFFHAHVGATLGLDYGFADSSSDLRGPRRRPWAIREGHSILRISDGPGPRRA